MAKMDKVLLKELSDIVKVHLDGEHILVVSDEKNGKREKCAFPFFGTDCYDNRIDLADQYNNGRRIEGVYTVKLSSKKETRKGVAFYLTLDSSQTEEYKETKKTGGNKGQYDSTGTLCRCYLRLKEFISYESRLQS